MILAGRSAAVIPTFGVPAVYRLYDKRQRLLYVGSTSTPVERRLLQHSRERKRGNWWSEVAYYTVETFPNVDAARAAETAAIEREEPQRNVHKRARQLHIEFQAPPGSRPRGHGIIRLQIDPRRVVAECRARGWTRRELALAMGMSPATVGQFWRPWTDLVTPTMYARLARALGWPDTERPRTVVRLNNRYSRKRRAS